jgi:hypothetical protein
MKHDAEDRAAAMIDVERVVADGEDEVVMDENVTPPLSLRTCDEIVKRGEKRLADAMPKTYGPMRSCGDLPPGKRRSTRVKSAGH